MNLEKQLLQYIKTKKDWDILTIVRYVYLEMCKLFSYDYKYLYGTQEEKNEIYNKQPNIKNIENYDIVCSSWCYIARSIFKIFNLDCEIT